MPPKKKKGTAVIDGVDTSSMSREQLEKFAHSLRHEIEREREERNFFQLERDKLRTFWEITKNQLEEAQLQIRAKERDVEVVQEQAELDIKHIAQQMKHLQYENQNRIGEIRAESMTQSKLAQEDHGLQELELLNDKRELRRLLREKDEMTELQIQQLRMKQSELLSKERASFERELNETNALFKEKLQKYIDDSETKHQMEMDEIEERKSMQITELIEEHEQSYTEMRNYYNDITQNNLTLISSLKEQMEELQSQLENSERNLAKVTFKNKKLTKPLEEAQLEIKDLRRKYEHFNKERSALSRAKQQFDATTKQLNDLKWETEALRMRCEALAQERDQLKSKFEEATVEMQQKLSLKNVLSEKKLVSLQKEHEKLEVVLGEVLRAAGLDPQELTQKTELMLKSKNERIEKLEYEVVKIAKAHDDLLRVFMHKLEQFGIPKDDLGFEPIRMSERVKYSAGPAGIVVKSFPRQIN